MDHRLLRSGSSIVFSQAPQLERPLAHLSAIRFEGLSPQDRGYGPIRVRADPKHSKSCHVPIVRSILPARKVV
jgi:hypothetical protein